MEYLLILLACLLVAVLLDWRYHLQLYRSRKERILIPIIFLIIGTVWDSFAVQRGHWMFSKNLLGVRLGYLPIEEYLFFLIVPYMILTVYRVLRKEI